MANYIIIDDSFEMNGDDDVFSDASDKNENEQQ